LTSENILRTTIRGVLKEASEPIRMPMSLHIPADLQEIHRKMKLSGKQLFIVGGAVRDTLMNKEPKDYDLATDAAPDEVINVLETDPDLKIDLTGKAFGVVRVWTPEGNEYEIATFRKDIGKGRRPESVEFTSIEDDVKRRDLTINALFYDMDTGEAVDYVGGLEDIKKGVIRSVGDPTERFDEDKLRILRAVRFAGRMGSEIDPATKAAILSDNDLSGVSPERTRDEFIKGIRSAKSVADFLRLTNELLLFPQIFPGLSVSLDAITSVRDHTSQIAMLLVGNDIQRVSNVLRKMKYTRQEIDTIMFLHDFINITPENAPKLKKEFKRARISEDSLRDFADSLGKPSAKAVDTFLQFAIMPPAADPRNLMSQGLKGPDLGKAMQAAESDAYAALLGELRQYVRQIFNEVAASRANSGGDCYEAAGRYMMNNCRVNSKCGMKLVHAEVTGQGEIEGLKYGHAFVLDDRGTVIDRSNGRNIEMPKEIYYAIGHIGSNVHEYTWDEARQKMLEFEHWGPWDLSTESGH
jgi:tRNA nucleotidyltransferase/poly(A) polymerase